MAEGGGVTLFGPDFYPTPPEVAATMLDSLDLRGRVVIEPSAGSGNLVRECLSRGAAEALWDPIASRWSANRWVPKHPTVPKWLLAKVEAHMQKVKQ
jgi:hypothetical protein